MSVNFSKPFFHGSRESITNPDLMHSRVDIDFGQGFYLTQDINMAEKWAVTKAIPIINSYRFKGYGLSIYEFELDKEWLEFVKANRNADNPELLKKYNKYDVLIGPTADDKLYDTIGEYIDGIITANEAVKYLNIANHSNQIVLKTNAAIEQCQFIEARQIPNDKANIIRKLSSKQRIEASQKLKELKIQDRLKREREEDDYGR